MEVPSRSHARRLLPFRQKAGEQKSENPASAGRAFLKMLRQEVQ